MLRGYFTRWETGGNHLLSNVELRKKAAAVLKAGADQDGIEEVERILAILRSRAVVAAV